MFIYLEDIRGKSYVVRSSNIRRVTLKKEGVVTVLFSDTKIYPIEVAGTVESFFDKYCTSNHIHITDRKEKEYIIRVSDIRKIHERMPDKATSIAFKGARNTPIAISGTVKDFYILYLGSNDE